MSGDEFSLGGEPGASALVDRQIGPSPVGSIRRLIRRTVVMVLLVGAVAALAAWVVLLAYGGIWVWRQLPLV